VTAPGETSALPDGTARSLGILTDALVAEHQRCGHPLTATPEPAKLRRGARELLAELAVQQRVAAELQALADEKLRDYYGGESRLRAILEHLGLPADEAWKAGALDVDAATALLNEETTP